jgi:hypothetical protein
MARALHPQHEPTLWVRCWGASGTATRSMPGATCAAMLPIACRSSRSSMTSSGVGDADTHSRASVALILSFLWPGTGFNESLSVNKREASTRRLGSGFLIGATVLPHASRFPRLFGPPEVVSSVLGDHVGLSEGGWHCPMFRDEPCADERLKSRRHRLDCLTKLCCELSWLGRCGGRRRPRQRNRPLSRRKVEAL